MKHPKPNKYGRVRTDAFVRFLKANAEQLEARCRGKYTDDYKWDADTNFSRTDWLKVQFSDEKMDHYREGFLTFRSNDFGLSTGGTRWDAETKTWTFYVHSNESYEFRVKA